MNKPILRVSSLRRHFSLPIFERVRARAKAVKALDGVSFEVFRGETLGIVGESGCGKSTLARAVVGLDKPTSGMVEFDGVDTGTMNREQSAHFRARVQMVFQDPFASLDPRMSIERIVSEGWRGGFRHHRGESRRARVFDLLESVRIPGDALDRYPHQFSGGQRQRIGIARALAMEPTLLVCDEPTSGLDVSVQAQVLDMLRDLKRERELTMLFIGHDLPVIRSIADRVVVMYLGKVVEIGPSEQIFEAPTHPYTKALLSATPDPIRALRGSVTERIVLHGDLPSPLRPPSGCRFRTRCWKAQEVCSAQEPLLADREGVMSACHFPEPSPAGGQR